MAYSSKTPSAKQNSNPRALKAKIDIRERVLDAIGADKASVFDAFAGAGDMHEAVWKRAASYTGCDLRWMRDARRMFCADNRRVLRAIDLRHLNIFDLDAYGTPFECALIIADRRPIAAGELLGLVLTEGAGLSYKANVVPAAIAELTGLRPGLVGLSRSQDAVIDKAVVGLARRMSCTIKKRWQASGRTGSAMRYIGLVLKGR